MPVFVVMIENKEGVRGVFAVCASEDGDHGATRQCYAASHLHFKAWYEPHVLQGAAIEQEQPECAQT